MAVYSDLTVGGAIGLILTIEGCPYAFATGGVQSVSFTSGRDDDWPSANASVVDATILPGALVTPDGWSESVNPIDGTVDVSAIAFKVHDLTATSGDANGYPVLTWLTSRALTSTPLTATLSSATTTNFDVADGSIFGAKNFTVWVGREAIRIVSRASNTLTIETNGRGALGTLARTHRVNTDEGVAPEVYTGFPWMVRRKAVLWAATLTAAGDAADPTPLWRGAISQAPRLSQDRATWELATDSVITGLRDVPLGLPSEACRSAGIRTGGLVSAAQWAWNATAAGSDIGPVYASTPPSTNYESADAVCTAIREHMRDRSAAAGYTVDPSVSMDGGESMRLRLRGTSTTTRLSQTFVGPYESVTIEQRGAAPVTGFLTVRFPAAAQLFDPRSSGATPALSSIHMDSVATLPTTWSNTRTIEGSGWRYAWAYASLIGSVGDAKLVLDPSAYLRAGAATTVVDTTNRNVAGHIFLLRDGQRVRLSEVAAADLRGIIQPTVRGYAWLLGAIPWSLVISIEASDWVLATRYRIIGDTILAGTAQAIDADSRDWTWTEELRAANMTPPRLRSREIVLNGEQTLDGWLLDNLKLSGAFIGFRRSRMSIEPLEVPLRSDVCDSNHTRTIANTPGAVTWQQVPDGLANVVDITLATSPSELRFVIPDQRSVAKYGTRRKIECKPRGIPFDRQITTRGARYVGEAIYSRTLGLHAEICEERVVPMPATLVDTVSLGDKVSITDWITPNGTGNRGTSASIGVVLGRDISLRDGTMRLRVRAWPHLRNASGWAPCARLNASAASTITIEGPGYVKAADDSATDYSGSDQTGYANASRGTGTVANDGGTGAFLASDKVRIVERDVVAPQTASLTVSSVNPAAKTITMTGAIPAWVATSIAAGTPVDVVYDNYDTPVQTSQKVWPFVCARSTRVIAAGSDAGFVWAP